MSIIPERLAAFRVYLDGSEDIAVADIELPVIEFMTDTVSGAGIAGEYESATIGHTKPMKTTLAFNTPSRIFFALLKPKSQRLTCHGAIQLYDTAKGEYKIGELRVVMQTHALSGNIGKFETGKATDSSVERGVTYLKIEIDKKKVLEIDQTNYKFIDEDGVDYHASIRDALGL